MRVLVRAGELSNGSEWRENVDVLVEDGVVKGFGRPAGLVDKVLEAPIVIPGLVDAHVHVACDMRPRHAWNSMRNHGLLFLIHGVMAVRDLGNSIDLLRNYMYMNPELTVQYSIAIDVPPYPWFFMRPIAGPEDGVREVERAFVEGASWVKLYNNITEDIAKAVIARARELGLA